MKVECEKTASDTATSETAAAKEVKKAHGLLKVALNHGRRAAAKESRRATRGEVQIPAMNDTSRYDFADPD